MLNKNNLNLLYHLIVFFLKKILLDMIADQEKEVLHNSNNPKDIIPNKESKITSEIFNFMKKTKIKYLYL